MAKQLEEVILTVGPDELGAVIVEPMTAGGGILVPPAGYYETIREICDKYELLLIIDEVVCGLGRTGKWFATSTSTSSPTSSRWLRASLPATLPSPAP